MVPAEPTAPRSSSISPVRTPRLATGEVIRFDGFLKLYSEDPRTRKGSGILPKMAQGESVNPAQITATERFTAPPARYNEASLVKRLEELGIGRPSTYAPTITTIINRGYVVKQNKEGQKRGYVQLTLTGSKIAEKGLPETYGKEKTDSSRPISAWWSMTTSNRNSSRSWTTTSRPTSKGVRPHRRRRDHLEQHDRRFLRSFS